MQHLSGSSCFRLGLISSQTSAQSPPSSPRLTDTLSQFPCPVPAAVRAQPRARRPFSPPQRKWPVLLLWHISTGPRKLLTQPLLGPRTSACKVRLRTRTSRWRDSEVSTLQLNLTASFVMSSHACHTFGEPDTHKQHKTLAQGHCVVVVCLHQLIFNTSMHWKNVSTWSKFLAAHCYLQDGRGKLTEWSLKQDVSTATEDKPIKYRLKIGAKQTKYEQNIK